MSVATPLSQSSHSCWVKQTSVFFNLLGSPLIIDLVPEWCLFEAIRFRQQRQKNRMQYLAEDRSAGADWLHYTLYTAVDTLRDVVSQLRNRSSYNHLDANKDPKSSKHSQDILQRHDDFWRKQHEMGWTVALGREQAGENTACHLNYANLSRSEPSSRCLVAAAATWKLTQQIRSATVVMGKKGCLIQLCSQVVQLASICISKKTFGAGQLHLAFVIVLHCFMSRSERQNRKSVWTC